MYYVTMTDKFLSGWGEAENKISKYVIECETLEEANIVAENAEHRSDMKSITIRTQKPSYPKSRYHTSYVTKETAGNWFKPNFFKPEEK